MDRAQQMRLASMLLSPGRSPMPQMSVSPEPLGLFQGLRNSQELPPPEPPGTLANRYMPPLASPSPQGNYGDAWQTPPPMTPAPVAQPAPAPPPVAMPPMGGQGWGGPEPAPGSMPAPYDANLDPRYLPEQWRGAWNWPGR